MMPAPSTVAGELPNRSPIAAEDAAGLAATARVTCITTEGPNGDAS